MEAATTTTSTAPTRRERKLAGSWVWLFPVTYFLHIAEEYWGEFPLWVSRFGGGGAAYTSTRFLLLNGAALLLMVVGVILALKLARLRWLVISFGVSVLMNALTHVIASLATHSYSPGLSTGLLFWVPLGAYTLHRSWRVVRPRTFWASAAVGALIHAVVNMIALSGGRIGGA
jgi:Protein of unknown function with HXXEE motif